MWTEVVSEKKNVVDSKISRNVYGALAFHLLAFCKNKKKKKKENEQLLVILCCLFVGFFGIHSESSYFSLILSQSVSNFIIGQWSTNLGH